jgi:anthranilate phosphoribosyltransferase
VSSELTVTEAIDLVASGTDLTGGQAEQILNEIMNGDVGEAQTAAFLIALRSKGETVEELAGLARTMRRLAVRVSVSSNDLVDTAGTGGGTPTFNISTVAALIAAAAGCHVAKHGNRSATSLCGSADLIEALGARIDLEPEAIARCIEEVGFGFMFAPRHHQATKYVVPVRKALGVRTIFNFLGPLTNPAGATRQVIGVFHPGYLDLIANALVELGCERALVVAGEDGMDELSAMATSQVVEVSPDGIRSYEVSPEQVGLERAEGRIPCGTPDENAETARRVLEGDTGVGRSLAVLNAGAAILVAGKVSSLEEGVRLAEETIDSGAASQTLGRFVALTGKLAPERTGQP